MTGEHKNSTISEGTRTTLKTTAWVATMAVVIVAALYAMLEGVREDFRKEGEAIRSDMKYEGANVRADMKQVRDEVAEVGDVGERNETELRALKDLITLRIETLEAQIAEHRAELRELAKRVQDGK